MKPLTDHFIGRRYLLDDETMIQSKISDLGGDFEA